MCRKPYCIDVLQSIISSKKRGYFSNSTIRHEPSFIIFICLVFAMVILIIYAGYRNASLPGVLKYYLNMSVDGYGYAEGRGQIIKFWDSQHSRSGDSCSYIVQVTSIKKSSPNHNIPQQLKLRGLYCNLPKGTAVTFIYKTDDPSTAQIVDRHEKRDVFSDLFFMVMISVYIIWFVLFFAEMPILSIRRRDAINRYEPLVLHLLKVEDFNGLRSCQVELLSDSEKEEAEIELTPNLKRIVHHRRTKSRVGFWFNSRPRFERFHNFYVTRRNNVCVRMRQVRPFSNIMHCYLYAIKESELIKAAGIPLKNPKKCPSQKKDRTIFFVGPWQFRFSKPAEELNLYITDNGIKDYFTTVRK